VLERLVHTGRSLAEYQELFPDEASCAGYLFERRWPDGFVCRCGSTRYASLKSRAYTCECLCCGHQTSITAGTVMHRSHLPLTKWFSAAYLVAIHHGAMSARQLQMQLGIAYQTAWSLKKKLQLSTIPVDYEPLQGIVEVDHKAITFRAYSQSFSSGIRDKINVVIAIEVPNDDAGQRFVAPRSSRLLKNRLM
jgi:hypothetical protein